MNEALIEIHQIDLDVWNELVDEAGLEVRNGGESVALDGAAMVSFTVAVLPSTISLVEFVLRRFLDKRRPIEIYTPTARVKADSVEEIERILAALNAVSTDDVGETGSSDR